MKLQNLKIYLYIPIFTIFSITNIFSAEIPGLGSIVFDPTNQKNQLIQIEHMVTSIDHQIDIMKAIGKGDFNPQVIGYLDNLYTSCGGKKKGLPNFLPKITIPNLCSANEEKSIEKYVNDWKDQFLLTATDTPQKRVEKQQKIRIKKENVYGYAGVQSQITLDSAEQNAKVNTELMNASKGATSSLEVQKLQLQVQLQTLQQLQRNNELLAIILQNMVWK